LVRYIAESEEDFKTLQEPPPTVFLVLMAGGRPSQTFPLRGEVQLGRDRESTIVVADQKVSRRHANMTPLDDTYILTDLGSANGTYLNGVQIAQPTRLKHQDRLSVGDTHFVFAIGQPDLVGLERPMAAAPPLQALVQPLSAAKASDNLPLWMIFGCMGIVILALLLVLALVLGLYMGSNQMLGVLPAGMAY
jgi:hypothetical protein